VATVGKAQAQMKLRAETPAAESPAEAPEESPAEKDEAAE